jgi:putative aldouronate transport system substrate-binding protein
MKRVLSILALMALFGAIAVAAPVKTLKVFINMAWYPTKTFTGIIPDEITRLTGVKLDPTITVNDQQLGVMIASGQLPDLVYSDVLRDRLSNASVSYDYDSLISKYNVNWKISPQQRGNALSFSPDGKLYTVVNYFSTTDDWRNAKFGTPIAPSLFLRQYLLDQLGNPPLKNLDDLTKIFGTVKTKWPDIVPFTFDYNWRFNVLRMWEGVTWADFVKQADGTYKYYIDTKNYYNMLKLLNGWFQKGYMSADNFAATNTTATAPYSTGKAFSLSSCTQNNNVGVQGPLTKVNPKYITVESMPLANYPYLNSSIGWAASWIPKKSSDPETAIKLIAWMFSPAAQMLTQNGRPGTEYTMGSDGVPKFTKEWMAAVADGTQVTKYDPWFYFGANPIDEALGRCASLQNYDTYYAAPYKAIKNLYENDPWIAASLPVAGTDEKDIYDTVSGMVQNFEAKVIMSASDGDFEKNYNDYMAAATTSGVQKLEAYMSKKVPQTEKLYK